MSEDILRLTLDLYSFVQDTEPLTTDRKLALNTQRFRDLAEDLRGRFERARPVGLELVYCGLQAARF